MTTIFISGSRVIPPIPEEALLRVDKIVDSGFEIVIGDSSRGVDAVVLQYLAARSYEHVSVYTIHDKPRAKGVLDIWDVRKVEPTVAAKTDKAGNTRNARELETEKDQEMGDAADFGLVIWQPTYTNRFGNTSVSKGSLRNMHQLLSAGKPVVLYKADSVDGAGFSCFELKKLDDLKALITTEPDVVSRAYKSIKKSSAQSEPTLFGAETSQNITGTGMRE